ncbi:unnamed protein product [Pieris macdunnoughi]|uniref:Uncharacterized protein n=1 Tax=Pieris macdunnoughi TaxID=345717 RepID=A0A821V632_9NEOP|nr:unnamed protein product [Pieris macdunnoughi]
MCLAFCCMKQCYTSGICSAGCSPRSSSIICGYGTMVFLILLVVLLIFYFTDWFENFFVNVGINPCTLFRKFKSDACQLIHGVALNRSYSDDVMNTTIKHNITERTIKIYLDKYREMQSEDDDYFYDSTRTSIQELVNEIKILNKSECIERVTPKSRKPKSTHTLPVIENSTKNDLYNDMNLLDYHASVLMKKLKRYRVLERALSKELHFNRTS